MILIVIVVWLILPIHTIIFYEIRENAGICAIVYNQAVALYHSIYLLTTGGILPAAIMIGSALLIRHNLATNQDVREQQINVNISTTQHNTNVHLQRARDQNALAMLLMEVMVYCIVQAPQFIYTLYAAIASNVPNKSPNRLAIEKFSFFYR